MSFILPFLEETSQWTQILPCRDSPTSSLVRVTAQSIKRSLQKLNRDILDLEAGEMKTLLVQIHESLVLGFWR